ncbi:OsmC family protein [Methylobacterium sp. SD274]|uniref:OsmC family protein n=1 Tax=unclassified Methylobacterium TaxID=2615210 RepID=UPI001A9756CE|nr:OsmC family protein [Methylobacterium sp. SD274]MBO1021924.1 OsmC family protein [Methylobacterium sp. SD274]
MTKPPLIPTIPPASPLGKRELELVVAKAKADPTAVRTLRCRTVAQGRLSQLNYIRDLPPQPVMEDEPEGLLGESTAPNASEALLAALGSCLSIGIHANALAQGIPIHSLELDVEADINLTSVWGSGDLQPKTIGFESIRVSVRIDADASRKALAALVKHTVLWSPVANTLHNPVHLDIALASAIKTAA